MHKKTPLFYPYLMLHRASVFLCFGKDTHRPRVLGSVLQFAGVRSLDNTPLYIQVEQAIFGLNSDDESNVKATNDKEEMKKLLSVGFEYVCQKDDMLFFRKQK